MTTLLSQIFAYLPFGRYKATPPTTVDGDLCEMQVTADGLLKVYVGGTSATPVAVSEATSTAYEASHVVKASAGTLFEISGSNKSGSTVWVMIFDASTVPSTGTAKKYQLQVPAGQSFSWTPNKPLSFGAGIVWAASSTSDTLTTAGAVVDATAFYS